MASNNVLYMYNYAKLCINTVSNFLGQWFHTTIYSSMMESFSTKYCEQHPCISLKIPRCNSRIGSNPISGTNKKHPFRGVFCYIGVLPRRKSEKVCARKEAKLCRGPLQGGWHSTRTQKPLYMTVLELILNQFTVYYVFFFFTPSPLCSPKTKCCMSDSRRLNKQKADKP